MQMETYERSLRELHRAIEERKLDLQPGFQRGDVWSKPKQQRLIDSVLRGWYVPPIHVVVNPVTKTEEILDGKQRLVAFQDFRKGEFRIDGRIEPLSDTIQSLHGLSFFELPPEMLEKFERFRLATVRLTDYGPDEPGELFFRLNQPANLTPPEQRNAFYGPVRFQVRKLVDRMPEFGLEESFLGFSNKRMAYDDIVARAGFSLQVGSLRKKVTASELANLYRSGDEFDETVETRLAHAMQDLGDSRRFISTVPKFNKATVYSWLCFHATRASIERTEGQAPAMFTAWFEAVRAQKSIPSLVMLDFGAVGVGRPQGLGPDLQWRTLITVFSDRASSRVADVASVILRDAIIWLFWHHSELRSGPALNAEYDWRSSRLDALTRRMLSADPEDPEAAASDILEWADSVRWGRLSP